MLDKNKPKEINVKAAKLITEKESAFHQPNKDSVLVEYDTTVVGQKNAQKVKEQSQKSRNADKRNSND